jgi:hypothetical protein
MKKIIISLMIAILSLAQVQASSINVGNHNHDGWRSTRLSVLITLKAKNVSKVTGYRFNIFQKISFVLLKNKMKRAIKKNPNVTAGEFYNSIKSKDKIMLIILAVLLLLLILFLVLIQSNLPG